MMSAGIMYDATSKDVFWLETDPAMWSAVEINLSVVTGGFPRHAPEKHLIQFIGLTLGLRPHSACLPLMRPLFQRLGCCIERKFSAPSRSQDSYEMTKLPKAARATVQNLENGTIGYPTRSPGLRAASVDGRTFWPRIEDVVRPGTSRRHTTEPSGGNREML